MFLATSTHTVKRRKTEGGMEKHVESMLVMYILASKVTSDIKEHSQL